jgi:hypothetical protein
MAYSISVAVGDSEMIAVGREAMRTVPLAAVTAAGKLLAAPLPAAGLAAPLPVG